LTYVEFFGLQKDISVISPEFNYLGQFQDFKLDDFQDVDYNQLILGMRENKLYNPFYILKILAGG
jgi:hypothetical protein